MSKWQKVKLGDICDILDSYRVPITAKNREVGIYPYYGANGIQDYVKDFIFDGDYVLVAEDGGYFGSKTKPISYKVSGKFWVNNHAHILKAKKDIFTDYLCYSTMFYDVSSLVNGATRQKLTQAALKEIKIPLPPMEEQKKIVARLDAVSDLLVKQKQLLSEQDNLIQSTFYDMFGNPIKNEKGWKFSKISSIYKVRSSQRIHQKDLALSGIPFLRVSDLEKKINCVSPNINLFISDEFFSILHKNRDIPEENDILITTRGTLGDVYIYKNNDRFYFQDGMITWLKPNKNSIMPLFFLYLFKTCEFKNSLHKYKGGTTVAYLSIKNLSDLLIPVPPFELQQKFAAVAEQIESEKSKIKSAITETQTLFNALMAEYFEE